MKPNYKLIVDKAIGEKPSLASPDNNWIINPLTGKKCWPPKQINNYKKIKMNKDHYIIKEHPGAKRSTFSVTKKRANGRTISYDRQFNSKQTAYRNIAANIESDLVMMGFTGVSVAIVSPQISVGFILKGGSMTTGSFIVVEKLLKPRKK